MVGEKIVGEKFLWELLGGKIEVVEFHTSLQVFVECYRCSVLKCYGIFLWLSEELKISLRILPLFVMLSV